MASSAKEREVDLDFYRNIGIMAHIGEFVSAFSRFHQRCFSRCRLRDAEALCIYNRNTTQSLFLPVFSQRLEIDSVPCLIPINQTPVRPPPPSEFSTTRARATRSGRFTRAELLWTGWSRRKSAGLPLLRLPQLARGAITGSTSSSRYLQ